MANIEQLINIGQVQTAYNWEVLVNAPYVNLDDFSFRARSSAIPDDVSEQIQISHRFFNLWYPGRDSSAHTIDLAFWDGEDLAVFRALNTWREAIQSLAGGTQLPKQAIVGTVQLNLLNGLDAVTGTWFLYNAWPESLQQATLDYTTSDAITITCTFRFDYTLKQF